MVKNDIVLVTGGSGYIGSALVEKLLDEGVKVRVVDALIHGYNPLAIHYNNQNFEFIEGDLNDINIVRNSLEGVQSIVHLAAIVGDPACARNHEFSMKNNYEVTKSIVDLAAENGVQRLAFASTCSNYGIKSDNEICTEEATLNPVSVYAVSKVKSEEYIQGHTVNGLTATILRFSTAFGLSKRMRFDLLVNDFTKEAITNGRVSVYNGNSWRPYLHIFDIADAIIRVFNSDEKTVANQIFNIGDNGMNYTKQTIADMVEREIPGTIFSFETKGEDPRSYSVDFTKIRDVLGFKAGKSISDGIKEIKVALDSHIISDPENKKYYN